MRSIICHKNIKSSKDNTVNGLSVLALFCLLVVVGITALGFFTNFDITDEGYVFHHHLHGPSEVYGLLGLHFLTYPVGFLFGHQLIGYRFLDLILFVAMSAYVTFSLRAFIFREETMSRPQLITLFSFIAISTLGYFVFLTSTHYNALSIIAGMGWSASLLFYTHHSRLNNSTRYFYLILLTIFTVVAFLAKFTFGFCLALCFPLFFGGLALLYSVKKYQDVALYLTFLLCFSLGIYNVQPTFWQNFVELLTFSQSDNMLDDASGRGYLATLIERYFKHFSSWFTKDFIPTGALLFSLLCIVPYMAKKVNIRLLQSHDILPLCAVLGVAIFAFLSIEPHLLEKPKYFDGQSILRILMAAFVSTTIIYAVSFWRKSEYQMIRKDIVFYIITLAVIFGHPVGTNTNFMSSLALSLGGFVAIFIIFYFYDTHKFQQKKILTAFMLIGLTMTVGYGIARGQIFYSYRNAPLDQQQTYSKYSPYLKGIKLEESYAKTIDNLWQALAKEDFDFTRDQIFAYKDMPGLLSAVGAKSFSEAWLISGYKNSVARTCLHVDLENPLGEDKIYVLSNAEMNTKDLDCFYDRVQKSQNFNSYDLGSLWHYRSRKQVDVMLSGPYLLR